MRAVSIPATYALPPPTQPEIEEMLAGCIMGA